MFNNSHSKHPLPRKGTSQSERYPNALRKDYVKIDERNLNDLIAQTAEMSQYFQFYEQNSTVADGNWSSFFAEIYDFTTKEVKVKHLEELEEKSILSPHLGLFIAFLKLFQHSIAHLNSLGQKHLMFFYETMLHAKPKKAVSSKVTLIGELSKDINQLLLPKGTVFRAGKNTLGEEQFFSTDQDFILNKAEVAELRTLNLLDKVIRQRNISNSADGLGMEILTEPKSWKAFGDANDKSSEIGFCITSPFLGVNEGLRTISITIGSVNLLDFDVFITTEKGWGQLELTKSANKSFRIDIAPDFPKIITVNEKIHGLKSNSEDPMLKFVIKDYSSERFFKYKNIAATINLTIKYIGIRDLSVKNELGKIDVSKAFQPFGSNPINQQSEVIIGHPILFSKYATSVLVVDGKTLPSNSISFLNSGIWEAAPPKVFDRNFDKEYAIHTKNNYIKLKYTHLSPSTAKKFSVIVSKLNNDEQKIEVTIPKNDAPTWKELSINATVVLKNTDEDVFTFYHLHPFELVQKSSNSLLLPAYDKLCYFWIGIQKLRYGQSLSLHFQLLEGSGDQDVLHPGVKWFIKQNDQILPLNENEIVKDTTLKLLQSGNLQFSLQKDRFNTNNPEADELLWLIASCEKNTSAMADFLAVMPQAFTANSILSDNGLVEEILPDSIKKSTIPISGLKKITQPYKSFGGLSSEYVDDFVVRISERLRHKAVAINIFDYERLLLQNFPFLYQVKCISHSNANSHQMPGHVLVVVVPKLKHDNSQIDLKPKVSVGNREIIRLFLTKISSPFVKIEVRNPNYQEIQIEVNIKYLPEYESEKEYYNVVLNQRLQSYIAPWIANAEGVEFNKVGYKSKYINFIEEQEFVDYITLFNLYINGVKIEDKVEAVQEDVVFTSVNDHVIRAVDLC